MTIAGYSFFSCLILLEFVLHALWNYFSLTASFGMFSMTCCLAAFSLFFANSMKKPSTCCLSPPAHRIINAWHDSGPDLQSAPTPWMLDASLPLEALNCFWLALPAWFLVLAWFSCLCGGGVCLQRLLLFMCMCNWPLTAEVPVHCEVCVTLWSFYCLYKIATVLIVQYCSPPLLAQTLLIFSTQIYFNPNVVCPEQGG